MFYKKIENYSYISLFDLKDKYYLELYFKFKNKYDYKFTKTEKILFQQMVLDKLNSDSNWENTKNLIIPETENINLIELAQLSGKKIFTLHKENKENMKSIIEKQPMMKSEKEKIFKTLDEMNNVKIAGIAGNQRKRFVNCLFQKFVFFETEKTSFFDDSIFSGYTFLAAQNQIKILEHENFILFDKTI